MELSHNSEQLLFYTFFFGSVSETDSKYSTLGELILFMRQPHVGKTEKTVIIVYLNKSTVRILNVKKKHYLEYTDKVSRFR